jgi:DNA-binding GntR family transcriptional regulator
MSRIPVMQALRRLERDGFVHINPTGTWWSRASRRASAASASS